MLQQPLQREQQAVVKYLRSFTATCHMVKMRITEKFWATEKALYLLKSVDDIDFRRG